LKKSIYIADFSFTQLRKVMNARNAESVIKSLDFINSNLEKFIPDFEVQ